MKGLDRNLIEASEAVEAIVAQLPKLTMEQKVDTAMVLKAIAKNIEKFDESVKTDIKKKLKDKAGTVLGEMFKAVLQLVPTDRFNQKDFQKDEPALFKAYTDTNDVKRITFEPR